MRHGRLPDGFGVRIDPRVRSYSDGRVLIGGSPTRMLKLAPAAAAMIGDGFLEVSDQQTAHVARRLLDSGVGNPRPRLMPAVEDITVVVPTRNNREGLERLLAAVRGHPVIIIDDGSDAPIDISSAVTGGCRVTVLRHEVARGPAAARNAGMRAATTEFVAFLDSDVVPRAGWLEVMLGHFSDPSVALVAPRIVALDIESNDLARYEHSRSSLDLGPREAQIRARSAVSYVPSAAMLARRRVLLDAGGFDETMQVAEDVDLCWRLEEAGWRLRYEPAAQVAHDHRVSFLHWFSRKMFYGTGAAPLGERHASAVAPLNVSPWTFAAAALLATLTKWGIFGALVAMGTTILRLRRTFLELDQPTRVAAIYAAKGFWSGLWQLASAACRHYWPVTLLAMIFSGRIRQIAIALALGEGLADWWKHKESGGLDPVRYVAYKRLDDVAYGAGLWRGAVRARSVEALKPTFGG
jgi:mycofactocin system glycosyltransferase